MPKRKQATCKPRTMEEQLALMDSRASQNSSSSSAASVGTLPATAPQQTSQLAPQTTPLPAVAPQPALLDTATTAKEQSEKNSKNRDKHGPAHVTGRKSFAELRNERRKAKKPEDKMSLWIDTHNKEDPDVASVIEDFNTLLELEPEEHRHLDSVKDKIFHQLVGPDGHRYCRTYGASAPPRLVHTINKNSSTPQVGISELLGMVQRLESTLGEITKQLSEIGNHIDSCVEKRIEDLRSEWMSSCPCSGDRGSQSQAPTSVHQKNLRESVGDGALVLSSSEQAALNKSAEPEDTEHSAHGVNDEDAA